MASVVDLPFPHPRNYPDSTEIRRCKEIIAKIDEKIISIELGTEECREQLKDLNRRRANYISYIAPFRRVPAEILSEIGLLCLENQEHITTVTSIHGLLRDAMIGMSSLWRQIRLFAYDPESPQRAFFYDSPVRLVWNNCSSLTGF
jgi:hypothetical protein